MQDANTFFTIPMILMSCLFARFCYVLAKKRSRDEKLWAILGFVFNIFAFIIILCLPKKQPTIKKSVKKTHPSISSIHSDSAAALDNDNSFDPPKQPRLSANKSLKWYYIDQNSKNCIQGPFHIDQLRKELFNEKLDSSTYVWCEEFDEWTMISDFSNSALLLDSDYIE